MVIEARAEEMFVAWHDARGLVAKWDAEDTGERKPREWTSAEDSRNAFRVLAGLPSEASP